MNHKILIKIEKFGSLLVVFLSHWHDLAALMTVLVTVAVKHLWVLSIEWLFKFYFKRHFN